MKDMNKNRFEIAGNITEFTKQNINTGKVVDGDSFVVRVDC